MKHYCKVWHLLVKIEEQVEAIKDKLLKRPNFNIDSAFRSLDKNFTGHITQCEIKNMMLEFGIEVSQDEL